MSDIHTAHDTHREDLLQEGLTVLGRYTHFSSTHRVTFSLPYDKGGVLDTLYQEAKVETVEYGETIDVAAVCTPKVLGQIQAYVTAPEP